MKSGSGAMILVVVLATLVSLTALFTSGDASSCDNVPTTTWAAACLNVSSTPAMYNLCGEMLQHAPDSAAVTVYAVEGARVAWQSYEAAETEAQHQIYYGSLPDDERHAYEQCLLTYAMARGGMAAVMEYMNACDFKRTVREYADAADDVNECAGALAGFPRSSLFPMNAADRDRTAVAIALGGLIVGHGM